MMRIDIKRYAKLSSTNETARELGITDAPEGTVVFADIQTNGRGRLGRAWASDGCCCFSVILRPQMHTEEISSLTLVAGMAVCGALRGITDLCCGLKWPNDVIVNSKKICGILIELNTSPAVNFAVVGIGVNVNNEAFGGELKDKATSVYMETGKKYEPVDIAEKIMDGFAGLYTMFVNEKSFKPFVPEYRKLCVNMNRQVVVSNSVMLCVDVSDGGELVVKDESGTIRRINSGEVSVRGVNGYV